MYQHTLTDHSLQVDPRVAAAHVGVAAELEQVCVRGSDAVHAAEHQNLRLDL